MTNYTQYQSVTLDNGLRIVHRTSDSPVMYCGFMVDCGTRDEKGPEMYGMAHFVEHVLFKGTTTRDSWHINNRMESVGGELNAFTTKEETTFYTIGLNKDFDRACNLLCDLICNPTVPQHELEMEREVVIDEIMSYRDTPTELIFDEFENRLFSSSSSNVSWQALGHNILGNEETVRTFDHEKSIRFIDENYTPDRMILNISIAHECHMPIERDCRPATRSTAIAPRFLVAMQRHRSLSSSTRTRIRATSCWAHPPTPSDMNMQQLWPCSATFWEVRV